MSDKTSTPGEIAGVAIQGSLEEASLPDVVQLLALGKKTGCLSLTEGTLRGEIYLDAGRICYAYVASRRDRIGDMLVRTGRITQQQLNAAITAHKSGRHRVSEILLASGQVQRAELMRFMQRQVEEAVYFMFTWRTGTFLFRSKIAPTERTLLVSIDPEALLLEGARRVDEWSVIEKKIPSFDVVYRLDRARLKNAEVELTEEQRDIVPLIDGARDVAGIIELAGLSEFDVGKALYGLIAAGFAQLVERRTVSRHLDYRELLAYVVREAEFADPEHRRAAARHIADCPSCSSRLKTIHVRRTGAVTSVTPPAATAAAPAAPATSPTSPTSPPSDRRSGEDRRAMERRRGERRRVRSAEWERPGVDRRSGQDRRHAERRVSDRRMVASGGGEMALMSATAPGRPSGGAGRTTGPRRPYPIEGGRSSRTTSSPTRRSGTRQRQRGEPRRRDPEPASAPEPAPSLPAAAAPDAPPSAAPREVRPGKEDRPAAKRGVGAVEIPDLPEETAASQAAPEASTDAAATDPDERARPIPAAITRHPRPEQRHPRARSKDIQWLVSPDEADDLVRTSRAVQPPPARAAPAKRGEAAPVSKVEAPAAAEAGPVPAMIPPAPKPTVAPERAPIKAPARAAVAEAPARQEAPRRSPVVRRLGAAAAMVALVAVGWVGASIVQGRSPVRTGETPQVPAETPRVEAQPAQAEPAPSPPAAQPTPTVEPPVARPSRPAPTPTPERETARAAVVPAPPPVEQTPARAEPEPAAVAVPAVGAIRGVVRDAASNAALSGVRVTIPGTDFGATTGTDGAYTITDVPAGAVSVTVAATGRPSMTRDVSLEGGATRQLDFALAAPPKPVARESDEELAGGDWAVNDLVRATEALGVPLAVIPGLYIESIAVPGTASRPRVRIAQLTLSGERIVLTETRSGAPVSGGNPRVTALRIIPASQTYPLTTGTASFGNLLVTAKAALPGDSLRALLATLVVADPEQ